MIIKKTLSEQIYDQLKQDILHKRIGFGEKLINKNLQTRFQVSSTPIRDAINRLYINGLIETKNNTGATVIEPDYDYFCEINEVLQYIQLTALHLSFKKASREEVVSTAEFFIRLQKENIDTEKYYDYDYNFHKTFVEFSGNRKLKELFKNFNILHEILVREYNTSGIQFKRNISIEYHQAIVDAYQKGDLEQSSKLMLEHYDKAQEFFKDRAL